MAKGFARGRSFGGGTGFGFRGASPPWPHVGMNRGGLPRCGYFLGGRGTPAFGPYQPRFYGQPDPFGYRSFKSQMTKEEELDYLKKKAEAVRQQLGQIRSRMRDLKAEQAKY